MSGPDRARGAAPRHHPAPVEGARLLDLQAGVTRCHHAALASGPPVLLVPGMTYPLEVWTTLFAALASGGFAPLRYDLPGRGGSAYDGGPLTAQRLADQAAAVLDACSVAAPAHVVSLSNGDLIAAALAARHPDRVRSVVWVAPSGFDRRTMRPRVRLFARAPGLRALWAPFLRRACARRMRGHRAHLPSPPPETASAVYAASLASVLESPVFPQAVISHVGRLPRDEEVYRDLDALARARIPVLALRFADEGDATEEGLGAFLGRVPQLRETRIPKGTHMGLLEHPVEVNRAVLGFLRALRA